MNINLLNNITIISQTKANEHPTEPYESQEPLPVQEKVKVPATRRTSFPEVLAQVDNYVRQNWSHLDEGHQPGEITGEIKSKIINVLLSFHYKRDPLGYVQNWVKERGLTEELRVPDDAALGFFKKMHGI